MQLARRDATILAVLSLLVLCLEQSGMRLSKSMMLLK